MEKFRQLALDLGFTDAVILEDLKLECSEELRAYCNPEQCPNYGSNWVCPPGCGTLDDCREKVGKFTVGLLVRSVTDLTPPVARETYGELTKAHGLRLRKLVEAMGQETKAMLTLSYGGCNLCEACSYPDPCRRPKERMDSLGAFGIDAGKLCETAGLPYAFREDRLYLTALVLCK